MGVPISSYPHTHGGVDKHFLKVTTIHLNLTIYQLRWITHLRWRVREKRKSYSTAIVSFREMLQSFSLTGICIFFFFWDSIFFTMYLSECVFFSCSWEAFFWNWTEFIKQLKAHFRLKSLGGMGGYKKNLSCEVRDPYLGYSCLRTGKTLPNMHLFHVELICAQPITTFSLTFKNGTFSSGNFDSKSQICVTQFYNYKHIIK